MALVAGSDDRETATSYNDDEPFTNLLRFVDVASNRIRQALERPRHCRRRVNHRKYLARILSTVDVTAGSTGNGQFSDSSSKPGMNQLDHQSKRKPPESARRHRTVKKIQSTVGSGPRSFAAVGLQPFDHISTDELANIGERSNDTAVAGLPEIVQPRCRRAAMPFHLNEPVITAHAADVSCGLPDRVTSTTNDVPHHSWFSHQAAVSLPQQSQQPHPELADTYSWYNQPGFRQPHESPSTGIRHSHTADCGDHSSSQYSFVNQQFFNASCSSAYQQAPLFTCDVGEWLRHVSTSSRRHTTQPDVSCGLPDWVTSTTNDNREFYCRSNHSATQSVMSPHTYSSLLTDDCNHDVMNRHCQQSTTSDSNLLTYNTPAAAVNLLQTPSSDQQFDYWMAENHLVDTSPSSFNDSGLGSISVVSATDIDGSGSTDSSFFWPSQYGVFPLQPTEIHRDSVSVQTVL